MRTEDGSIIHRCLSGDPGAFSILVDKYKAGIYAYTYYRLRNFQDAEDVTQEVFERAYRNLRSLKRWESFAFWLYRIASNQCRRLFQAGSRRPDGQFIEDQDPKVLDKPSLDAYRESQMDESLQEALDSLSKTYREVLILHYFGGMTIKDMARAIGASPTAIGMRLSRARAQLKEEMIDMMDTAFQGERLQASFTFRVMEAIKRIKVHPMPRLAGLPWGLSLAAGIIITILSLNPRLNIITDIAIPSGSQLPGDTEVLKVGEIPVDVMKISNVTAISSRQGNGKGKEPANLQNTLFLAPQGEGGAWAKKADMPTARLALSACAVDGKIYAIGGLIGFNTQTSTLEEYDPATDKWTTRASMLTERAFFDAGVVNGKIYVIGGETNSAIVSTVEEYDPDTDMWTRKTDMPTKRESLCACAVNEKIYAIGGMIASGQSLVALSTVEEYDPATDTWTKKADMLRPRNSFSAAAVNGKIYVFGGFHDKWATDAPLAAEVEEYDPARDIWVKKSANIPTPRVGLSTCVMKGKVYAIGGSTPPGSIHSTVEEYDPVADKWTKMPDMLTPRWYLSTSVVNGRIYAMGGSQAPPPWREIIPVVEEYTPEGWQPKNVLPRGKLPTTWGEVK